MGNLSYKEVLSRLGYFRNKRNLSSRETSLRLEASTGHFNRIERGNIELKMKTFLEFLNIVEISPIEFFYPKPENFEKDRELIEVIMSLDEEQKKTLLDVAKKFK